MDRRLFTAIWCRLFSFCSMFFFFNDTAPTEIYTLSLHDALPISGSHHRLHGDGVRRRRRRCSRTSTAAPTDRKSTRLNSSHSQISYAVFCLKKKKKTSYTLLTSYTPSFTTNDAHPSIFFISRRHR